MVLRIEPSLERTESYERHQVLVDSGLFFHRVQEVINECHERSSLPPKLGDEGRCSAQAKSVADFDDARSGGTRDATQPDRAVRIVVRRVGGFISYLDTLASELQMIGTFTPGTILPSRVTSTHGLS